MILEGIVEKLSTRRAWKAGYKAGKEAYAAGEWVKPPAVITDSLDAILDDMVPHEPHIVFRPSGGGLTIGIEYQRAAGRERWVKAWIENFRKGYEKARAEAT